MIKQFPRMYFPESTPEALGSFWRINDWKKAIQKIHSKVMGITGLNRVGFIRKLDSKITGTINRADQTISKDFAKGKAWSQEHRKTLQIAAAVAGAAVGGWALYSAYMAGGAGAGAAAAGAGAGAAASDAGAVAVASMAPAASGGVLTSASLATGEALVPLASTSAASLAAMPTIATVIPEGGVLTSSALASGAAMAPLSSTSALSLASMPSIATVAAPVVATAPAVAETGIGMSMLAGSGKLIAAVAPSLLAIQAAGAQTQAAMAAAQAANAGLSASAFDPSMLSAYQASGATSGGGGGGGSFDPAADGNMGPQPPPGLMPEESNPLPLIAAAGLAVGLYLITKKKKKGAAHA